MSAGEAIDTVTADRIHLEPGTGAVVSGRYRIVRLLGEGSTGTIFLVRDMKLDVDVILKLLPSGRADATREGSRLYRATRLARLIRHTNVARIFDIGEWEGREYVTMEHVPGRSLRARLRADGSFSFEEGLEVMRQLCAGLGAAHAAGVVHHDLNPTNIMLGPDGRIAIHDFGLAGWLSAPEQIRATGRSYLAPEQLEEGHTDHRADIYALGAVAFEMFYGTPPTPAALTKTRPDLPPRLVAVIHRCMDPSPQKRFGPMGEIISLLEMIRDHKTGH